MKKLFLSSLGINVLVLLINMATGILSARLLGPYGRGELAVANRWSGLFIMLFTIGLPGAVIYLGKQNPKEQRLYFGNFIVVGAVFGLGGLCIGEILMPFILKGQSELIVRITQVAMLSVPFGVLADGLVGTLQTINQFKKVMLARILSEVGALLAIVVLAFIGMYTARSYVLINTLWSILVFGITLYWAVRAIRPRVNVTRKLIKNLLSKGFQIYATSLVGVFGGNLDQLAISVLLTPYTLGLYAASSSISSVFPSMIIGALGIYLWPKLMDLKLSKRNERIAELHSGMFYGSLVVSVCLSGVIRFLVPLMYGQKYAPSVAMAEIMVFGAATSVGYVILTNYISTRGKFYFTTIAEAVGLISGFCVTIPLLHFIGGMGAAIGLLAANVVKWGVAFFACGHLGVAKKGLLKPNFKTIQDFLRHRLRKPTTGEVA